MIRFSKFLKEEQDGLHPFEASGLGLAPFHLMAVASFASKAMAEQNPTAYQNEMAAAAATARRYGVHLGTCQHCGMNLTHNYIIKSNDGKYSVVGSQCVEKTKDPGLGNAVAVAEKKRLRDIRRQKAEVERAANRARWYEANKDRLEKEAKEREARREAEKAEAEKIKNKWSFMLTYLQGAPPGSFKESIANSIEAGIEPRGRAVDILKDIYGKAHGRANSKAYWDAVELFNRRRL